MLYKWVEEGTRFNNKNYHFSMWNDEVYNNVVVRCTYGSYSTQVMFSTDEERFIYESLDEMKELLYRHSYI
ncbi:hypothetical protein H3T67_gp02 [Enterococcus phage vB_EfaP_Ef7.2]|uniref:Uncharacterized protein n=1 Tax=Enterococcus phage vB_EfaP_Ef7.2 TaxID=2546618 RepID=A0A4D6DRR6_9CAUD|nr:hypothetical protein H3T67_gp02 [Enterococcus phage vB_EfaP_Ef7.2]QBZ69023.1 hypothetical protein [Enterococcus phage vB_EfaP_Ef7.2]